MPTPTILVVDEERLVRWSLAERLRADGYCVSEVASAAAALASAETGVDAVLLDYRLPDEDGVSVLRSLHHLDPDLPVLMLTAVHDVGTVVDAIRAGAFDYITKPFDLDDVSLRVGRALETTRLRRDLRALQSHVSSPFGMTSIIGDSLPMQHVKALVRQIAASPGSTVLITGESGTGKDLVAKVIHYNSTRAVRPFVNITCSALPETLLESELFGHERGAFTDAHQQKRGLLEQADEGTVFLDEIGEMAPMLQAKLLRFLEEKTLRRIGGTSDIHVNVRVIAATNRNLEHSVRDGKFRDDLYYRLNVLRIEMPSLRSRGADISLLARHFLHTFSADFKRSVDRLSDAAAAALTSHQWPGNVRELRNLIERAVLLAEHDQLVLEDFESFLADSTCRVDVDRPFQLPPEGVNLEDVERSLVIQALERTGDNQTRAAHLLGIHRDQIRYRMEKFGLRPQPA